MAEIIVDPILKLVIDGLSGYVKDQYKSQTGMKKEMKRLEDNYPKIQAVVSYAKKAQTDDPNSPLNKWIWQLRDAIDEANDLLDDFEYKKHQHDCWHKLIKVGKRALKMDPELKRLPKVVKNLDEISAGYSTFFHLVEGSKQEQLEEQVELHTNREAGSLPTNDLIGRTKYKNDLIEWLSKPSYEETLLTTTVQTLYHNISVLSIVGDGGMGKTTLLQHVYQDGRITEEFCNKMWVCVSNNFDVKKVITDMLECLQKRRTSLETLNALQESLQSEVMSKKFLLVLDDIWDKEEEEDVLCNKLGKILAPLAYGGLGSKILITTRTDSVASMIMNVIKKKKQVLILDGMEEDDSLQLLMAHAFVGESPDDHENLISIAGELVKKLYGSPLVTKVMGGVLRSSLDERHWRNVLNSSMGLNGIFPILKLSYIFLPEHLQSCFSFCSIFEQDHIFDKDDLIKMWIAVGFIQPSHDNREETLTLEDIGERYFDVLIKKSFFNANIYADGFTEGYKMHDLLHELAQSVSKQECFRFVGDENSLLFKIPKTVRHLSFQTSNPELVKEMGKFKNLKTLLIFFTKDIPHALDEIIKVTRSIRLLHIAYITMRGVIKNIGYLHHLRYLSFPSHYSWPLPRSLSSLYNLQFLITVKSSWIIDGYHDYFPMDMNKLSNLRYLNSQSNLNFPGIGKLKFLRNVDGFCMKNENGYRFDELEHMNDVRILKINVLENVRDAEEARKAKLCDKRKLTELSLHWLYKYFVDRNLEERVLDNLQPHNYLKVLEIRGYMGARCAKWMDEAHLINLQEIYIGGCLEWEILPPFGQLPFLNILRLWNLQKVKRLDKKFHGNDKCCVFPSLKVLHLEKMEALVDWFDASDVDALFPCLTELRLSKCSNLQELPYLPPKLKTLEIDNIGWNSLNCCSISKSIPLESLGVLNCPNITTISLEGEIGELKRLTIIDCRNLISLGEEHQEMEATENCQIILDYLFITDPSVLQMKPLRSSISIRRLMIMNNDELVSFPFEAEQWFRQVSSSLRKLTIRNLRSVLSLPSSLTNILSLENLEVDELPLLRELPDIPPSLKELKIKNLPSLQSLPSWLTNIHSLEMLEVDGLPLLRELPDLPPSLKELKFKNLSSLQSLPYSLTNIHSLEMLEVDGLPLLRELPDLPPSLKRPIIKNCDLELMERYK